ncbi:MAG: hypothetical protein Q8Q94_01820 [bacterium]|nr:hypothetical protein [bacterium]
MRALTIDEMMRYQVFRRGNPLLDWYHLLMDSKEGMVLESTGKDLEALRALAKSIPLSQNEILLIIMESPLSVVWEGYPPILPPYTDPTRKEFPVAVG